MTIEAGAALKAVIIFFLGVLVTKIINNAYSKSREKLNKERSAKERSSILSLRFDRELGKACIVIIDKFLELEDDETLEATKMRIEVLIDELEEILLERASREE